MSSTSRLSEKFGLTTKDFSKEGVFDGFWNIDSKFHVDPALLKTTSTKELKNSAANFRTHFENVLKLVAQSKSPDDALAKAAVRMLVFPEIPQAALGYSSDSTRGRGFTERIAKKCYRTAKSIIDAGVSDPSIFELVGVLEDDVGPDLVSDMTLQVILHDLISFNSRVIRKLKLNSLPTNIGATKCTLPFLENEQKSILLLPSDILSPLPIATCWDDIDRVCAYNNAVRERVNTIIGTTWRHATRKISKQDLRSALFREPEALKDLIRVYAKKNPQQYDFLADPMGEIIWRDIAREFAAESPLTLPKPANHEGVVRVVETVVAKFKQAVENNGLNQLIFNDDRHHRPEKFCQLLFFGIADCYCSANNIDLSREPNAGRGPVDFKISQGYSSKVLVEIKLSSNTRIEHGFSKQVEEYQKAEQSQHEILLVIIVGNHDQKISDLKDMRNEYISAKKRVPDLYVVDARIKPSASKL